MDFVTVVRAVVGNAAGPEFGDAADTRRSLVTRPVIEREGVWKACPARFARPIEIPDHPLVAAQGNGERPAFAGESLVWLMKALLNFRLQFL